MIFFQIMKQPQTFFFNIRYVLDLRFSSEITIDNPLRACPGHPSDRSGKYFSNVVFFMTMNLVLFHEVEPAN